jgi:hypothetical protein
MTGKQLQRLALSFPEAHEAPHFERTSFRIGKKIFATMTPDGKEAMVRVPVQARVKELLREQPEVFFSYGTWTYKNGALGVHLAKVKPALMRELVTNAWTSIAPKRLLKRP